MTAGIPAVSFAILSVLPIAVCASVVVSHCRCVTWLVIVLSDSFWPGPCTACLSSSEHAEPVAKEGDS